MKLLAKNNGYELFYAPSLVNRYKVYKKLDYARFKTMVAQSSILTKKIKSYFTKSQIDHAVAIAHGMKHIKNFKD